MTLVHCVKVVTRKLVAVATLSRLLGAGGAYLAGAQAPVLAQAGHAGHSAAPMGADTPATKGLLAANDRMHKDMDIAFSGDADVDFLKGTIPHHQGAIDMAKVVGAWQGPGREEARRRDCRRL